MYSNGLTLWCTTVTDTLCYCKLIRLNVGMWADERNTEPSIVYRAPEFIRYVFILKCSYWKCYYYMCKFTRKIMSPTCIETLPKKGVSTYSFSNQHICWTLPRTFQSMDWIWWNLSGSLFSIPGWIVNNANSTMTCSYAHLNAYPIYKHHEDEKNDPIDSKLARGKNLCRTFR